MPHPSTPPIGSTGTAKTFYGEFRGELIRHDPADQILPFRVRFFGRKVDGCKALWCSAFTPDLEVQP